MREKFRETQIPLHAPVPQADPRLQGEYERRIRDLGGEKNLSYDQIQKIKYDIRYGNPDGRSGGRLPSDRRFDPD